MKKLIFVCLACIATQQLIAQSNYVLQGKITNARVPFAYLLYTDADGKAVRDSSSVKNGLFRFNVNINEPTWCVFKTNSDIIPDDRNKNITTFYLEPAPMNIELEQDHFAEAVIVTGKTQEESRLLGKQHAEIDNKATDARELHFNVVKKFLAENPSSFLAASELDHAKGYWYVSTVKKYYMQLSESARNSRPGVSVKRYIENQEANSPGQPAKAFTATDLNGNKLSLADFKGKYVLLDFWGSWCVPCRESMPHLIKKYNEYKDRGFEVIAIATEYAKTDDAWREAIQKDGTAIWHNILSAPAPERDNSFAISGKYAVHSFPTKILIDPAGIIIGRYSAGELEKMDKDLAAIYK